MSQRRFFRRNRNKLPSRKERVYTREPYVRGVPKSYSVTVATSCRSFACVQPKRLGDSRGCRRLKLTVSRSRYPVHVRPFDRSVGLPRRSLTVSLLCFTGTISESTEERREKKRKVPMEDDARRDRRVHRDLTVVRRRKLREKGKPRENRQPLRRKKDRTKSLGRVTQCD